MMMVMLTFHISQIPWLFRSAGNDDRLACSVNRLYMCFCLETQRVTYYVKMSVFLFSSLTLFSILGVGGGWLLCFLILHPSTIMGL